MCGARSVSARLKIDRAVSHINELQSVIAAFLKTDFYALWVDEESEPGRYSVRYSTKPLPAEVPLIIGDAIHNLHVPLDHIASDIVRSLGKDGDRVHFPKDGLRDRVAQSRHFALTVKAAPNLKNIVLEEIRPYKGGNLAVWETGKLDNIDKHKLLVPTLAITRLSGISAIDDNGNGIIDCAVTVDAEGTFNFAAFGAKARITNYGKPTFNIAFGKGSYFDGQPVVPTLIQLSQFVREAVSILERGCFGASAA
jgi:hypothetical protein